MTAATKQDKAARAMLTALTGCRWIVEMAVDDDRELKAIDDAIALAEDAGIKAEG